MILELAGARILSPYLGTSTFIWTSIIGIILLSLSLGYHLGGRLADKTRELKTLSQILFFASITIALTTYFETAVLSFIEHNFTDLRIASIIASIILFTPASILLGMVSPYTIRLSIENIKTSGSTVGTLYALSTIGSIFGTFLTGFYLLAWLGSIQIMILLSIILLLLSITVYKGKLLPLKIVFLILLFISLYLIQTRLALAAEKGIIDLDTSYSRVQIFDDGEVRYLEIGNNQSSAMYLDSDELVYEYTKAYDIINDIYPNFKSGKSLVLGAGAFSFPKHLLATYPNLQVDVVEIDPALTEISQKYFRLDPTEENLNIYNQDARTFLNKNTTEYDVIFGDAFKSFYSVPHQLTTIEAIQKHYDSLNENGVLILNIAGSITSETGQFFRAELATIKEVFPQVHVLAARTSNPEALQNILIIALKTEKPLPESILDRFYQNEIPLDMPVLTDNFAPVDQYMMSLFDYIKL